MTKDDKPKRKKLVNYNNAVVWSAVDSDTPDQIAIANERHGKHVEALIRAVDLNLSLTKKLR